MFVAMSYQCVGVPFRMAFGRSDEISSTDTVVMSLEVVFLLDMVLRFFIGCEIRIPQQYCQR